MAAGIMKKSKPSQVDKSDRTARPWKWLLVASVVIALLMLFFSIGFSEPKSSKQMRPQTVLVVTATARQVTSMSIQTRLAPFCRYRR